MLRQEVRRELVAESRKRKAWKRLCQIPAIEPIRATVLLGILQTPHRFRTKKVVWPSRPVAVLIIVLSMDSYSDPRKTRFADLTTIAITY